MHTDDSGACDEKRRNKGALGECGLGKKWEEGPVLGSQALPPGTWVMAPSGMLSDVAPARAFNDFLRNAATRRSGA